MWTPLLVLMLLPALPAATLGEIREIPIQGRVDGLVLVDVDGDGSLDLVASHHQGRARFLSWVRFDPARLRAHQPCAVPPGATVGVVADCQSEPGPEIVFLERDRLRVVNLRTPAPPRELARLELFFDLPDRRLPLADLAGDLDGDGLEELVLPTPDGYAILPGGATEAVARPGPVRQTIDAPYAADSFVQVTWTLPRLAFGDLDGDGQQDLVHVLDGVLAEYRPDGTVARREGEALGPAFEGTKNAEYRRRYMLLADVDQDGRSDLLTSIVAGNITRLGSWGTRIGLYRNRDASFPRARPDSLVSVRGVAMPPRLVDHDDDGDLDLILSTVRTDLATGISAATLKKLTMTYQVYPWEGSAFARRPVVQRDIEVPIKDWSDMGVLPFGYLHGDYDGDGRRDLLVLGDESFAIHRGGAGGGGGLFRRADDFADDPTWVVPADVTNDVRIVDLDRDGRWEVLFLHKGKIVLWLPGEASR